MFLDLKGKATWFANKRKQNSCHYGISLKFIPDCFLSWLSLVTFKDY